VEEAAGVDDDDVRTIDIAASLGPGAGQGDKDPLAVHRVLVATEGDEPHTDPARRVRTYVRYGLSRVLKDREHPAGWLLVPWHGSAIIRENRRSGNIPDLRCRINVSL